MSVKVQDLKAIANAVGGSRKQSGVAQREGNGGSEENRGNRLLSLRDVAVSYPGDDKPVLSGIDLDIHTGESVLFLGPSGCGKSTLAMLCAGLIPGALEADVTGEVWRHPGLSEPGSVGVVFQDPETQLCMLEVGDEIAFGLENQRVPRDQMKERIAEVLRHRELDVDVTAQHVHFSGGMKQKLAIACALAMDPLLLVCDEPTANLDPHASRQVFAELVDLHRRGQTFVVIEHKFDPLLPYMDRVVLFDRAGQIHRVGPTRQVLAEEWEWLREIGVVAPWKGRPEWLGGSPMQVGTGSALMVRDHAERGGAETADAPSESVESALPAVRLTNARLAYGTQVVWDQVNLGIPQGSFMAIVGPNGAGKSSLLQVIMGLTKLTSGRVELFGRPLADWSRRELTQAAAYCFQNPEFQFIYERVADELANRVVVDDVPDEVRRLLAEFGLAGTEKKSPFSLSQGQKRRLSVAAMLREPHRLYLLDEPTFGQDAATQAILLEKLAERHREGATIVLTTHDMDLVRRYATQVVVVADGGICFVGSPRELFARPDVLSRAHLLDDVTVVAPEEPSESTSWLTSPRLPSSKPASAGPVPTVVSTDYVDASGSASSADYAGSAGSAAAARSTGERRPLWRRPPAARINPAMQLLACVCAILIAMFVHNLRQGIGLFTGVLVLMMGLAWLGPWQIIKRLSPFLGFYAVYVWTLTAYAKVAPGTPTFDVLWYHLSWPGFWAGLVLALRMLSAVALGVYVLSSVDITELLVAFCKNLHTPPKFVYGMLAGVRYLPLFQSEWTKLKQARQLRGRDARWAVLRPAVYALPLLSQAVRMAERVAIAMEARGFHGDAARHARGRTYYRDVQLRPLDVAYAIALNISFAALVWLLW
jgi:energy-coupling factor transporter ATP-binding protein EcfA2/energy-coupling factor transporter transmembrane protein EcfT